MDSVQTGKRNGYIYGYVFNSGKKGLVLDEGPNEYPISSAEFLINGDFILVENLTIELLQREGLYGSMARIKENYSYNIKIEKELNSNEYTG